MHIATQLPRISIITPSYNQGHFIEQTIQSVLSQGYPNLEYLVIDGGSTDETLDILRRYNGRLTWVSERDRGQSHAINKGFAMASGEIIAFLNSDDLFEPHALATVGTFFASHQQATWLTGKCRIIDHTNNEIRKAVTLYKNFWLHLGSYPILHILNFISQPATFWRRSLIEQIGPIDERLNFAMDYDYWLRIGAQHKLSFVNSYLARFRLHLSSKTQTSGKLQLEQAFEVSRKYTTSPLALFLHKLHDKLTLSAYREMNTRRQL